MIIHEIKELDTFSAELSGKVTKALCRGAYLVRDTARNILLSSVPNANKQSSRFKDTLVDGIQLGKLENNTIKVHAMGNGESGSGTYRTRFFVGGTKDRFVTRGWRKTEYGVLPVTYKKPINVGRISANDAIAKALLLESSNIHNNFKNIQ